MRACYHGGMSSASASKPVLVVGSKNYSSWSLRPWLFARKAGYDFDERVIHFDAPDYQAQIAAVSRSRRVPVLLVGTNAVWDSLAICEFVAESTGRGLPRNALARARGRSVAAEMHAGFAALRDQCPMNVRAHARRVASTPALAADIARIDEIWSECRREFGGGGWLLGEFSVADAMYAPVCFRFATYGAALSESAGAYLAHALADPAMREWAEAALIEGHPLPEVDAFGQL